MKRLDEKGGAGLTLALIAMTVLFIGALVFAVVEVGQVQNYKTNTDAIVAKQVKIAVDKNSTSKDNEFAEAQKSPTKIFNGPTTYGSIVLKYPKTWSAYADLNSQGTSPVDAYFNPNFVPATQSDSTYALRLQVTSNSYDRELQQYESKVEQAKVKIKPYSFPNVKGVVGVRVEGEIDTNTQGTIILIPLRDKTIKLWTETNQYQSDFTKYVLQDFKFSP